MDSTEGKRVLVKEEAYRILREWIVQGKLAPLQRLRDKELAAQLGVSRTPVREALLRLENEGLVASKPNSSTVVAPLDIKKAHSLYSIVWTLEILALEQGFERIERKHIDAMEKANQQLLAAIQQHRKNDAVEADNEFHRIFVSLAQNGELSRILAEVKSKLSRMETYYFEQASDGLASHKEHVQLIEALKRKDLAGAIKALQYNWTASVARITPNI